MIEYVQISKYCLEIHFEKMLGTFILTKYIKGDENMMLTETPEASSAVANSVIKQTNYYC